MSDEEMDSDNINSDEDEDVEDEDIEIDEDDDDDDDDVLSFDENTPVSSLPSKRGASSDDMFGSAVSGTENDYQVFDIKEIITKQQQEVEKIADILGIAHSSARVLLRKFGTLFSDNYF
jgi:hypothetical protein